MQTWKILSDTKKRKSTRKPVRYRKKKILYTNKTKVWNKFNQGSERPIN